MKERDIVKVKNKIWIEDDNENLIFGGGKTQILEYIDETGSIAEAAKKVGMNYKKAWSHVKILQEYIDDELVIINKGRSGGGTILTPKAKELIENYKQLQKDIRTFANQRFAELFPQKEQIIQCTKENECIN
jgi:molybdate transport repressor ModE-like protein